MLGVNEDYYAFELEDQVNFSLQTELELEGTLSRC